MKKHFIVLFFVLTSIVSFAQTEVSRPPRSWLASVAPEAKTISISPLPTSKSSIIRPKGRSYFGKLYPCDIDFMEEAMSSDVDDGTIYTLSLTSRGAYSIGIRTEGLSISQGSELYLYDNGREDVLGALTDNNGVQVLRQILGDTINVELYVPKGVHQQDFKITKICHDFANAFGKGGKQLFELQTCSVETDVNCNEGQDFQDVKHAVVLLCADEYSDSFTCTGTIVNNTMCDQTPYVLTAAHCVCDEESANHVICVFNYEKPSCNSINYPSQTSYMYGATLAATSPKEKNVDRYGRMYADEYSNLDFSLLRLASKIPDEFEPYYAGISLSETENLGSVAVIHHPRGDVKKISRSYDKPYQDNYPTSDRSSRYNNFVHWHVAKWDVGTTEDGSSGSALLNTKKQIVGILSGGFADCSMPENDYFQMISKVWSRYPKPENQLKALLAYNNNVSEILPYNPLEIGEKYMSSILSAQVPEDSSIVYLSWQQNPSPKAKPSLSVTFDDAVFSNQLDNIIAANVDMDNDKSTWQITKVADVPSGEYCMSSMTTNYGTTNDYLTFYKIFIKSGDTLKFWARSVAGVSQLTISQNTTPSRFQPIETFDIDGVWREYKIPLDDYAGTSIYIQLSHNTMARKSKAVLVDDIIIEGGHQDEDAPIISGYDVYCNHQLIQSINGEATKNFAYNLERGKTYTFYVRNRFADGGHSGIGNSVVIDLDDTPTPSSELKKEQETLIAYPNPTTGVINISAPHNIDHAEIYICDMAGRNVMSQKINNIAKGEYIKLSLAALRAGSYIIRLENKIFKILKQ